MTKKDYLVFFFIILSTVLSVLLFICSFKTKDYYISQSTGSVLGDEVYQGLKQRLGLATCIHTDMLSVDNVEKAKSELYNLDSVDLKGYNLIQTCKTDNGEQIQVFVEEQKFEKNGDYEIPSGDTTGYMVRYRSNSGESWKEYSLTSLLSIEFTGPNCFVKDFNNNFSGVDSGNPYVIVSCAAGEASVSEEWTYMIGLHEDVVKKIYECETVIKSIPIAEFGFEYAVDQKSCKILK